MNEDLKLLYGWTRGSRERLFRWAETLPPETYTQERSDFAYGSLRNIQAHIALCYLLWIGRRGLGLDISREQLNGVQVSTVKDMREHFQAVDRVLDTAFEQFTEPDAPIEVPDGPYDPLRVTGRWLILHPITHEFHHKGQMLALGRVLGHPYPPGPDTDLLLPFETWESQ